jgi:hypothetical protein
MSIRKSLVQVGADVEVFARDNNGNYKSVVGMIGGSKDFPRPLDVDGCAVQEDNVAAEYNVPPTSLEDSHTMFRNIEYVMDQVRNILPPDLTLECCSSAHFAAEELSTPQAQLAGCEPDYNAWDDGNKNEKPDMTGDLRSCGGHLHISCPNMTKKEGLTLIKALDKYLGVPAVLIDRDKERRELYGKAGCFRFKTYGDTPAVEYRVLSNWWTKSEDYVKFAYLAIERAIDAVNAGEDLDTDKEEIVQCINEGNEELAQRLCAEFRINLPIYEFA